MERRQLHEPAAAGIRLWRDILNFLAARTPEQLTEQFPYRLDVLHGSRRRRTRSCPCSTPTTGSIRPGPTSGTTSPPARDGTGTCSKTLRAIKASTLILTGIKDLLNPEYESRDAFRYIPASRYVQINPGSITGHLAASGLFPADVEMLNREIGTFIERGQTRVKKAAETPPPTYDSGPHPARPGSASRPPRR